MERKKVSLLPGIDYVTVLIILFFLGLVVAILIYFKHRVESIGKQTALVSSAHVASGSCDFEKQKADISNS